MIQIGQFAKDNDVTIKTLHYYEKIGLLNPIKVDENSGYRYYLKEQSIILSNIVFLKELGLSLSEIKDIILEKLSLDEFVYVLELKKSHSKRDKELADARVYKLTSLIDKINREETSNINYKELLRVSEKEMYSGKYGRGQFITESEKLFEQAKQNNGKLSVIQIDMDYFHNVNKTYGYEVGDIVLERSQDAMLSVLYESKSKSLFEKRGGDEFGITIEMGAIQVSTLISKMLNRIVEVDYSDVAKDLKVTATAGISILSKKTKSYSEMVQSANIALYENKKRNR